MRFNPHFHLEGQHAFLSASSPHWVNYEDEKLDLRFINSMAAKRGTELHQLAHEMIRLGIKAKGRNTFAMYVNDAIGFKMTPEQILYYSDNCFGTPDAIKFSRNKLRIHDLKTGEIPGKPLQLEVYGAIFCLEYLFKPFEIEMEFRIYQHDEIQVYEGDPDRITHIMDRITTFDKRIDALRMEGTP